MRVAYPVLYLPFHLIQSALGQKVEAKPGSRSPRERRQRRPAMACGEEARLAGRLGSHLSRVGGRASLLRAKSVALSAQNELLATAAAVTCGPTGAMLHAITSDIRFIHSTDEVPRRRAAPRSVTASHKKNSKSKPHALAPGTRSHWPRLQGCQQSQSSPAPSRDERRNRYQSVGPDSDTEKASLAAAATKWPDGTSSRQPAFPLRNVSQHGTRHRGTNPLRLRPKNARGFPTRGNRNGVARSGQAARREI
jgi:hypothetical protein